MKMPDEAVIEQARQRLGIPADWVVGPCEADCGDVAFYSPDQVELAATLTTPFVFICSAECAVKLINER